MDAKVERNISQQPVARYARKLAPVNANVGIINEEEYTTSINAVLGRRMR
jgi:hypothetical protein